jgi:hypothetical protein
MGPKNEKSKNPKRLFKLTVIGDEDTRFEMADSDPEVIGEFLDIWIARCKK